MSKPATFQTDLAKLPKALAPLIERKQWAVWKWTQRPDGSWQKPPFQARDPQRHASTSDPVTWADYRAALAAVQARHADGISYVLKRLRS
jgi:primase-polymerase (primpol)-like protein